MAYSMARSRKRAAPDYELLNFFEQYRGCCPVVFQLEDTLIEAKSLKTNGACALGTPSRFRWNYGALSLLKSLGADERFVPVILSDLIEPNITKKVRQSHSRTIHFIRSFNPRNNLELKPVDLENGDNRAALLYEIAKGKAFPRRYLICGRPPDSLFKGTYTLIGLAGTKCTESVMDFLAQDLRELQSLLWFLIQNQGECPMSLLRCAVGSGRRILY